MKMKFRKLWPLLGALFASLCVSTYAETRQQYDQMQSKHMQHQSGQKGQKGKKGPYQRGMYSEITPNAGPRVAHGADVFLTADYILQKLTQDGMAFAQTGLITNSGLASATDAPEGKTFFPGFGWDSGFKVGLGLNLSHDGWDVFAEYTWLRSRTSDSADSANSDIVGLQFSNLESITGASKIKTDQRHRYNVVNLELGRNFYVSQFLMLRPHFGFSGTWQRVKWNTDASGISSLQIIGSDVLDNVTVTDAIQKNRDNNRYWGVGIRGGLNTAWHFTTQWSIFANLAWTAMWSSYNLKHSALVSGTATLPNNAVSYTDLIIENINPDKFYRVKYVGEAEIGIRWEIWFYDDNYHFAIQTGWSETVWLNHMTFVQGGQFDNFHDLNLHGLDVKFRFDF